MWIRLFKLISIRFLLFIIILLCGCATSPTLVKVQINPSLPFREVEKIPLRVGLYLDPKFINYSKSPGRGDRNFILQLGEALSNGAQNVTNKAFREVVNVYTIDAELLPKELDALVIPEVDRAFGGYGASERPLGIVIIRIKWKIIDLSGKILYMNTFVAEEKWNIFGTTILNYFKVISKTYTKAIEEEFIKAYMGITSTNWWQSIKKETK